MSDDGRIAAYYNRLVDTYGHDPRAVDASSRDSLDVRYAALCGVTDLTGKRVLEVGCGFGDLGAFIRERFEGVSYRGVDLSPRMVEEGRRAHPGLELSVANVLDLPGRRDATTWCSPRASSTCCASDPEARMRELVERMFALASEAVAFTAISAWSAERDPEEFYVDPGAALELGRSLTKAVVVRHDYHPGDLTVYLYKREWR